MAFFILVGLGRKNIHDVILVGEMNRLLNFIPGSGVILDI